MDRVIDELEKINSQNNSIIGITLKGKSEMCLNSEVRKGSIIEMTDLCGQLRKNKQCEYYNNYLKQKYQINTGRSEDIIEFGIKNNICPYYLVKKMLNKADIIITTFNYLVHPFIRSIFFKDIEKNISECIILFDEGHNLIDIAREIGTSTLSPLSIKRAINELIGILLINDDKIINFLEDFKSFIETSGYARTPKEDEEIEVPVRKSVLKKIFDQISVNDCNKFLENMVDLGLEIKKKLLQRNKLPRSSLYSVSSFLKFLYKTLYNPQYIHEILIYKKKGKVHCEFLIKTLDIRLLLSDLFQARNILVLSGTLSPINAFRDICGFPSSGVKELVLPSPFPYENIEVFGVDGINLSYENRNPTTYNLIKDLCIEIANNNPYNTGIFCPSYSVLNGLMDQGIKEGIEKLGIHFFREFKDIDSKENELMIKKYKELPSKNKRGVLLGVSGGRNSEGVDFPGNEMSTVIVVGIPLAMITYSTNRLIKYYKKLFGDEKGLDYAYYIPAIRKANQTAGRPIRRLDDKGIIFLMDERFFWKKYFRLLSDWIKDRIVKINGYRGLLSKIVKNFYNKNK